MSLTITDAKFGGKNVLVEKITPLGEEEIHEIISLEQKHKKGAIWIFINQNVLHLHLPLFLKMGYHFHQYDLTNNQYIYYKWNNLDVEDKVPKFATSIGGAAAIILSKDESKIFLVFEYGKFKLVTGSVETGELSVITAFREVKEETGIQLDQKFITKVCGLWNIANARTGKINDTLVCYLVKAEEDDFELDTFEVSDGRWFDKSFLMEAFSNLKASEKWNSTEDLSSDFIEYKGIKLSICALIWMNNYFQGKFFENNIKGKINLIY